MGGSVVVGVACERRSTIASVEASPETARAKNIFIAEAERTQPPANHKVGKWGGGTNRRQLVPVS